MSNTRLYKCWIDMKSRCLNPNNKWHYRYGGRGITVCDEWLEFLPFYEWSIANGYSDNLTIERIDNDGNYEPSNCKWCTQHEQSMNKTHLPSKTGFVGVRKHIRGGYVAEVTRFGKYHYIGYFETPEAANLARISFLEVLNEQ